MGSFEWMELQTLTSDINASRSRLTTARANKDNRVVRILEAEITEAEARRDRLLASITTNLAASGAAAQNSPAVEAADAAAAPAVEEPAAEEAAAASAAAEPAEEPAGQEPAGQEPAGQEAAGQEAAEAAVEPPPEEVREAQVAATAGGSVEGGMVVWDQLTPADIQRALAAIGDRRDEMLARHAEELKSLEVEQAELEGLEKAIDAFVRRLNKDGNAPAATASAA